MKQPVTDIAWKERMMYTQADGERSMGVAGPVVGTIGKYILVAGGANFPGPMPWDGGLKKYHNAGNLYTLTSEDDLVKFSDFQVSAPVAYAGVASTPLGVVYAGGEDQSGPVATVRLLKLDEGGQQVKEQALPDLPFSSTNGTLLSDDSLVFFLGGENRSTVHDEMLLLDLSETSPKWVTLGHLPNGRTNFFAALYTYRGLKYIMVGGGRQKQAGSASIVFNDVHLYDIENKRWRNVASFPTPLAAGTVLGLPDQGVLVFGGDIGAVYQKTELLISSIEAETDPEKKNALTAQRKKVQAEHPGFTNHVLFYDHGRNQWKSLGAIPYPTPVTTTAIYQAGKLILPSGELRPGIRSTKMLIGSFKESSKNQ